jgi:hypothetical protein
MRDARYLVLDHLEQGAQFVMTGSPWGQGFFRQAVCSAEDGDPDFAAFGPWKADMNPRNPKGWIDRERERLSAP